MKLQDPHRIALAVSDEDLLRCFPVMLELRAHVTAEGFLAQVRRQMCDGYRLAHLDADGEVQAVAGFRYGEFLAWGKTLYVDDLVTRAATRSRGYGTALFEWLLAQAALEGCDQLHLDSGVQRFAAHRFYLRNRMDITSHHFALRLKDVPSGFRARGGVVGA